MRPASAPQCRNDYGAKHRKVDDSRRLVFCELCGCTVSGAEGARMQHEQGSRHRRRAATQRHAAGGPAEAAACGGRDGSADAERRVTRAPLSSRVAEPADPLLSQLTSEIAGQLHVSHVVRHLSQGKKHALSWWEEVRTVGLRSSKPTAHAAAAPCKTPPSPPPTTAAAVPLDLLVAQDSALATPLPAALASAARPHAKGVPLQTAPAL